MHFFVQWKRAIFLPRPTVSLCGDLSHGSFSSFRLLGGSDRGGAQENRKDRGGGDVQKRSSFSLFLVPEGEKSLDINAEKMSSEAAAAARAKG